MEYIYKIELKSKIDIKELMQMVENLNEHISVFKMTVTDFNVEMHEDDELLVKNGGSDLKSIKPNEKFNYISGYLNFAENGSLDSCFRNFKKQVIKLFPNKVNNVLIQEAKGIIDDENFVEIPD